MGVQGAGKTGVFNIQVLSRCLCAAEKNKVIISSAMERAPWPSGHHYCERHRAHRQLNSPWKLYWKKKRKEEKKTKHVGSHHGSRQWRGMHNCAAIWIKALRGRCRANYDPLLCSTHLSCCQSRQPLVSLYYYYHYFIVNSLISRYNLVSLLFRLLTFLIRCLQCEHAEQRQRGDE